VPAAKSVQSAKRPFLIPAGLAKAKAVAPLEPLASTEQLDIQDADACQAPDQTIDSLRSLGAPTLRMHHETAKFKPSSHHGFWEYASLCIELEHKLPLPGTV
jgi:hypothetical protein